MALAPFQRQFRSMVFGANTAFGLETADEESLPPISTADLPRDRLDGSYTGLDLARTRTLQYAFAIPNVAPSPAVSTTIASGSNGQALPQATINVAATAGAPTSGVAYVTTDDGTQGVTYTGVTGTTLTGCIGGAGTMSTGGAVRFASYYLGREFWRRTFAPVSGSALPLSGNSPDWDAARRIYARPRRRHQPENQVSSIALSAWTVELECPDPLWYDDTATTSGPAASVTIMNEGNTPSPGPTPGLVTLTTSAGGTITGPSGGNLHLTGGGPYVIDLGQHTISGAGGYPDLDQSTAVWFLLQPGSNTISISTGTITVVWRSAWL